MGDFRGKCGGKPHGYWLSGVLQGARSVRQSEGACHHPCTALKKTLCGSSGRVHSGWHDRRMRRVRDLSCGGMRIFPEVEVRRVQCRSCARVKRERPEFLADNPFHTQRFAHWIRGRTEQQDARHPATRIRTARPGVPAAKDSHLHAARALKCPKITHTTSRRPPNNSARFHLDGLKTQRLD